jgi:hypothetical protein
VKPAPSSHSTEPARRRFVVLAAGAAVALGVGSLALALRAPSAKATPVRSIAEPARPSSPGRAEDRRAQATPPEAANTKPIATSMRNAPSDDGETRLERAETLLENYQRATRYPPDARPIEERPDLVRPHHVPTRRLPLARDGKASETARVTLRQDRYFVTGDEQVTLVIGCQRGPNAVPCEVVSSQAAVPPEMPRSVGSTPVLFNDDGQDGDEASGDGVVAASLKPKASGFGAYHGPIRVEVALRVGGESGSASFDLQYTPAPPARFTGAVREAVVEGSLELYVGIKVEQAGRYVLRARLDDADGKPFAYLSYNEVLQAGTREARLRLFGKLVRDQHAKAPFRLRDVEGFLLKEDAYPDRETMPALEGPVYTTGRYSESAFSDAEWESAEKARHVRELTKDVEKAASM